MIHNEQTVTSQITVEENNTPLIKSIDPEKEMEEEVVISLTPPRLRDNLETPTSLRGDIKEIITSSTSTSLLPVFSSTVIGETSLSTAKQGIKIVQTETTSEHLVQSSSASGASDNASYLQTQTIHTTAQHNKLSSSPELNEITDEMPKKKRNRCLKFL